MSLVVLGGLQVSMREAVGFSFFYAHALQVISATVGAIAVGVGLWSLSSPDKAQRFIREFPRNESIGRVLMLVDVIWSLWLLELMDLGSWNRFKPFVYYASPLIYWFIIRYVNQYLGARSLALLLILAARPVAMFARLSENPASLVLTVLAYMWVVWGICIFSVPHWMRDIIAYGTCSPNRWKWGARVKVAMGVLLLALAFFVY